MNLDLPISPRLEKIEPTINLQTIKNDIPPIAKTTMNTPNK